MGDIIRDHDNAIRIEQIKQALVSALSYVTSIMHFSAHMQQTQVFS